MPSQNNPDATGKRGGFYKFLRESEAARETIRAMLAVRSAGVPWRGTMALPPGSPLDELLGVFYEETDIPLEIPFFAVMQYISGMLLARRVKVQGRAVSSYPDLWTIVLAPSGSGKTFAHQVMASGAPVQSSFPEVASGARFIEAFQKNNFGLWFQDEFAQKLKQIETPGSPMADIKDYLLRAYGYSRIERSTKKETITIDEPCLGILGLNTIESFLKALSAESLLDGFAARFAYVIAERDPARPMVDFPLYNIDRLRGVSTSAFARMGQVSIPDAYAVGTVAEVAFKEGFSRLFNGELPEAFYRRIMFRAFKYAAIYHVILGKNAPELDAEDMGWAVRVCALHIQDMRTIAGRLGLLHEVIDNAQRAEKIYKRLGRRSLLTTRRIQQGVRGVKTADEARVIAALV